MIEFNVNLYIRVYSTKPILFTEKFVSIRFMVNFRIFQIDVKQLPIYALVYGVINVKTTRDFNFLKWLS